MRRCCAVVNCGIGAAVGGCSIVVSISGCGPDDRGSITHIDFVQLVYPRTRRYGNVRTLRVVKPLCRQNHYTRASLVLLTYRALVFSQHKEVSTYRRAKSLPKHTNVQRRLKYRARVSSISLTVSLCHAAMYNIQ
jgi:hypothetical protein